MLQFLVMLIEWVASAAMMLAGLSYSAPEACGTPIELISIQYAEDMEALFLTEAGCASFDTGDTTETVVFRI